MAQFLTAFKTPAQMLVPTREVFSDPSHEIAPTLFALCPPFSTLSFLFAHTAPQLWLLLLLLFLILPLPPPEGKLHENKVFYY